MFYRVDARNAEIEATVTKYPKSTASSSQSASSSSQSASSSSQSVSSSSQSASTPSKGSQSRGKHPSGTDATPKGTKMIASHLQKLTPKQVVIKKTQPTDFFGRVIKVIINPVLITKKTTFFLNDIHNHNETITFIINGVTLILKRLCYQKNMVYYQTIYKLPNFLNNL